MTDSHMKRNIGWCILLLIVVLLFPFGLSAQQQTQTASDATGFYYTVQKGDTLWDISQKFFNNSELWPDLWSRNSQLTNPHWIYPGDVLHIFVRGGKLFVEKMEPEAAPEPVAPAAEPEEPAYFLYSGIEQVGFIRNPAVSPAGSVFKIENGKVMAATGDTIYIRQEGAGSLPVGSLFTLYRNYTAVKDPANPNTTIGTQHYLTGIAEVTRREDGYSLAKVIRNYRDVEIDDRAMPYEAVSPKIYLPESTPEVSGAILLSEEHTQLLGEHSIAFIDKGAQDGVANGQQFHVYTQERVQLNPGDEKSTLLPPVEVGTLLVLHTEQNNATVLVLSSSREFGEGTPFCKTMK